MASTKPIELFGRLSRRETSVLCEIPVSAIDKAIEQQAIRPVRVGRRVSIPVGEVAPLLVMRKVGVSLPVTTKRKIRDWLTRATEDGPREFAISDVLVVRYTEDAREKTRMAALYAQNREKYISSDQTIKGGEPVIVGTRLTARAVRARIDGGDTMDDLVADYPYISREALETALIYARGNPPRGRPRRPGAAPTA